MTLAVVVPATDSPPTLARCLAALAAADEPPDEVIVVDEPRFAGPAAARNLGADEAPEEDVLVCGDDGDAKALVLELAERITAGRAIDCGPLASARALEGLTAVIVNVNKRYKAHAGVRISGVR